MSCDVMSCTVTSCHVMCDRAFCLSFLATFFCAFDILHSSLSSSLLSLSLSLSLSLPFSHSLSFSLPLSLPLYISTHLLSCPHLPQGGFLVIRPSIQDYKNLIKIMTTVEFKRGRGWGKSNIGWFWGGMTVQVSGPGPWIPLVLKLH
jgi:hypothetical protein